MLVAWGLAVVESKTPRLPLPLGTEQCGTYFRLIHQTMRLNRA